MKQTAVEWLVKQLWESKKTKSSWKEIEQQAKAMEKEQIIYAHESGVGCNDYGYGIEYYNETFK